MGNHSSKITRLGTVLLYLPFLLIGYLLLLASVMKLAAVAVGWGVTIVLFGVLHLAISAWGMTRGRHVGAAERFDVLDPAVAPKDTPPLNQGPSVIRPALPPPFSAARGTSAIGIPAFRNTLTNFLGSTPIGRAEGELRFESGD